MIIGQTIGGHYRVVKLLGKGGFGETYLAEDIHLPGHPPRVIKLLKPLSNDPFVLQTARRLFEDESQVLNKLGSCDRVPKLFAHFEENQEFYFVQELIAGKDLSQEIIPGKPWSQNDVLNLLHDILEVLSFVHQQGVIHRDIKPSNLMRRQSDGKIVLIDFGAVKQIGTQLQNPQVPRSQTVPIGTEGYMPSEQMNGYPKFASDIYAMGMVGIEALTGVSPSQLSKDPNTLEVNWRNGVSVSVNLATILDKMVRYHYQERYQGAEAALQDIKAIISGSCSKTLVVPPPTKLKLLNVLSKLSVPVKVGISVISLGLVAISIMAVANRFYPTPQPTSSPSPTETVEF
jgi:serine/threonine protein kinase